MAPFDSMFFPLVAFSIAMYITPGPNNVMVAASAARYGIWATMPHMLGIVIGFSLMLTLVCAGLGTALVNFPLLLPLFRWCGAIWLVWLAWQIATAPPPGEGGRGRVLGFVGAMGFQWINPKGWLIAISAAGEYLETGEPIVLQLLRIGMIFLAVGLPCVMVWALLGSGAGRILRSPERLRIFNVAMAVLLVLSVLPVLIEQ